MHLVFHYCHIWCKCNWWTKGVSNERLNSPDEKGGSNDWCHWFKIRQWPCPRTEIHMPWRVGWMGGQIAIWWIINCIVYCAAVPCVGVQVHWRLIRIMAIHSRRICQKEYCILLLSLIVYVTTSTTSSSFLIMDRIPSHNLNICTSNYFWHFTLF